MNWQIKKVKSAEEANSFSKELFDALTKKEISKNLYRYLLDEFEHKNSELIRRISGYRLDRRSLGEFAVAIYENVVIEQSIIELWLKRFWKRHFPERQQLQSTGMESSGLLVFEQKNTKGLFKEPDFKLNPSGMSVEVKSCPCTYKATYKTKDLEHYISIGAWVLTGHYQFPFRKSNLQMYTLLSPEDQQKLLDTCKEFSGHKEYGSKKSVQMHNCPDEKFLEQKIKQGKLDKGAVEMSHITKVYKF